MAEKITILKLLFLIFVCINSYAQDFKPLLATNKSEWLKDVELISNNNLLVLTTHNTTLDLVDIELDVEKNNNSLTTLSLYNDKMKLIKEKKVSSTQDSIFLYNFLEENVRKKEIIVWGFVIRSNIKQYAALWLDYDLNIICDVVYNDSLDFFSRSDFIINSADNIIGASLELDKQGNVLSTFERIVVKFEDKHNNYVGVDPYSAIVNVYNPINDTLTSINKFKNYDPFNTVRASEKIAINIDKTCFYTSILSNKCSSLVGYRPTIIKYNTSDYSSELFYEELTENCFTSRCGEFGIDLYSEDYIYYTNKSEGCGFIPFTNDAYQCEVEYVTLTCLDKDGNLRWSKYLGGDALYTVNGVIATADSGSIVFVTRYERGVNIKYETDTYYLKFDKFGNEIDLLSSIDIFEQANLNNSIMLFPNPVKDNLNITNIANYKQLELELFNLSGESIFATQLINNTANLAFLNSGYYTYILKDADVKIKFGKLFKL